MTDVDRLALSPAEAAAALGVSRTTVAEAIRRNEIDAHRLGGRWLVPVRELHRILGQGDYVAELEAAYRQGWADALGHALDELRPLVEGPSSVPAAEVPPRLQAVSDGAP